jgi:hypothetical protein
MQSLRPRPTLWLALTFAALLTACAGTTIVNGESVTAVRQRLGTPSAEHAQPDGGSRLEYGGGSFGTRTLMVDIDAQGRVLGAENVRDEAHFNRVQAGISLAELRRQLGEPSRVWGVRYRNQTVWSYRFESPFCQIFNVGITPQGIVEDTSYGPDPLCEDDQRFGQRLR